MKLINPRFPFPFKEKNMFEKSYRVKKILINSLGVTLSIGFTSGAIAQEQAVNNVSLIEEVLVTGSHIRQKTGFEGASPVSVVGREDMTSAGAQDLLDVASLIPANSGTVQSQETGNLIGTSQFNIRGLGAGSTLTLINGRRGGISTVSDSTGTLFFDNKQLPLAMISRMEVQTDGASATYGSDAVGGVVNIITRKGFEGFEVSARGQDSSNESYSLNIASGARTENAMFNLYATAYGQTRNHRTDFDWLVERIHGNGDLTQSRLTSALGSPGTYRRANVIGIPSTDPSTAVITETGPRFADPDCEAAFGVLRGGRCRFNFADQVAVIPEEKRLQVFAESEINLSDSLTFFTELSFSRNEIQRTQGANAYRNGLVDGGDIFVPASHPFNFWIDDPADPGNNLIYVDPANWDNNIHTAVDLVCECRPMGFEANGFNNSPPFNRDIDLDYHRAMFGFDKELNDNWLLSANLIYSESTRNFRGDNFYNSIALNGATLDGTFNPFGTSRVTPDLVSPKDGVSLAGNSDGILEFIQNDYKTHRRSKQSVADIIVSGDIFEIGGNPVGAAFGYQYRSDELAIKPDGLTADGLGNNPERSNASDNRQTIHAFFAEAALPLTNDLDMQLAVRYEDYGGTVGDTVDPKLALRWQATEQLAFRGSFGTAFRGPSIPQTGLSTSATFIDDPFTGDSSIVVVRTQGSDTLVPESSTNVNLGLVYQPTDALNIKLDYWRFEYEDLITADEGPQAIVDNDFNDDGIANDPRVLRTGTGQLRFINSEFINTGKVTTDGIDLALTYTFPVSNVGDFDMGTAVSWVNSFDVLNSDGTTFDGVGSRNFTNQFSSLPKIRANAYLGWASDLQSANITVRYIDSYKNDQNDGFVIDSIISVDLRYAFEFDLTEGASTEISVGARNIFDEDPPSLGLNQRPAYDDRVHDIRGRTVYAEVKYTF